MSIKICDEENVNVNKNNASHIWISIGRQGYNERLFSHYCMTTKVLQCCMGYDSWSTNLLQSCIFWSFFLDWLHDNDSANICATMLHGIPQFWSTNPSFTFLCFSHRQHKRYTPKCAMCALHSCVIAFSPIVKFFGIWTCLFNCCICLFGTWVSCNAWVVLILKKWLWIMVWQWWTSRKVGCLPARSLSTHYGYKSFLQN